MRARVNSPVRTAWTVWSTGAMVLFLAAVALAQQDSGAAAPATTTQQPVVGVDQPVAPKTPVEPYVAEATGNDVYIRSGPGTNFYQCGKLYAGDRVQVINAQLGWSCIIPPPGCFSWVSMQYVSINLENPTMGIITGDNVGVYAGSDFVEPMWSTSKQAVLNRGQTVRLLGEEKDDYYKIAPPQGAYLWVSSQFLQTSDRTVAKPAETVAVGVAATPGTTPAAKPAGTDPNAAPAKTDLDIYYALAEQISAERTKPVAQQDYTELKARLQELIAKQDGSRAMRYADYTLKQVERFELACKVAKEVELQNKERAKVTEKIDEARAAKLSQIVDTSRFVIIGKLETSSVYADSPVKRYRLIDETGKTISYATPTGAAVAGCDKLVGHKVGLVGQVKLRDAAGRAVIEFSEAVPLD